jgi:hypothetical protein
VSDDRLILLLLAIANGEDHFEVERQLEELDSTDAPPES